MKELLISGSATHHNLGDVAMMRGLISFLQESVPEQRIVLVTRNPDFSRALFGVPCRLSPDGDISPATSGRPRKGLVIFRGFLFIVRFVVWRYLSVRAAAWVTPPNSLAFFETLKRADALVVHGSGSFNSIFWAGWLYPKAFYALCARMLGVPVLMSSQGIGPLRSRVDRLIARIFFRHATFIGVRDGEGSRNQALQSGAPPGRIHHTGDDAMLLPPAEPAAVDMALATEAVPSDARLLIGVNFRDSSSYDPSHRDYGHEALAAALDEMIRKHQAHVVFIPISYDSLDDDRKSADRVVALMGEDTHTTVVRGEYGAPVIRGMTGRMRIVAGASYHFLLFALGSGVPVIALTKNEYYCFKHLGLLNLYGQEERQVQMQGLAPRAIAVQLEQILARRDEISAALAARQLYLNEASVAARKVFISSLGVSP